MLAKNCIQFLDAELNADCKKNNILGFGALFEYVKILFCVHAAR